MDLRRARHLLSLIHYVIISSAALWTREFVVSTALMGADCERIVLPLVPGRGLMASRSATK